MGQPEHVDGLYPNNAYRLLRLPASASRADILEARRRLTARVRLGAAASGDDPFAFVTSPDLTEAVIRDAAGRLELPATRLAERLMWLDRCPQHGEEAFRHLQHGNALQACVVWQLSSHPASRHNSAILLHALALEDDPGGSKPERWAQALELWRAVLAHATYWEYVEQAEVRGGFEPAASAAAIKAARDALPARVLRVSVQLAERAMIERDSPPALRHLKLIRGSGFPEQDVAAAEQAIIAAAEDRLRATCDDIARRLEADLGQSDADAAKGAACDRAYQGWRADAWFLAEHVCALAGLHSDAGRRARDVLAICGRSIAIETHNTANRYELAERILREAKEVSPESPVALRIAEELPTVSRHAAATRLATDLEKITVICRAEVERLEEKLKGARTPEELRQAVRAAAREVRDSVRLELDEIERRRGRESESYRKAGDIWGATFRKIAILAHNEAKDAQTALDLLADARSLCSDPELLARIDADLADLRETARPVERQGGPGLLRNSGARSASCSSSQLWRVCERAMRRSERTGPPQQPRRRGRG